MWKERLRKTAREDSVQPFVVPGKDLKTQTDTCCWSWWDGEKCDDKGLGDDGFDPFFCFKAPIAWERKR